MKPIRDRLSDTKPKNLKKIDKAFEQGGCSCYQNSFMNEVFRPTAIDFPKVNCIVTDTYFCCYGLFGNGFCNIMTVIPLNQIVNLYRSNIDRENKYDYEQFFLAIELLDGSRTLTASVARDKNNFMEIYGPIIHCVRSRMAVANSEV